MYDKYHHKTTEWQQKKTDRILCFSQRKMSSIASVTLLQKTSLIFVMYTTHKNTTDIKPYLELQEQSIRMESTILKKR
jgi:hypothetical protein